MKFVFVIVLLLISKSSISSLWCEVRAREPPIRPLAWGHGSSPLPSVSRGSASRVGMVRNCCLVQSRKSQRIQVPDGAFGFAIFNQLGPCQNRQVRSNRHSWPDVTIAVSESRGDIDGCWIGPRASILIESFVSVCHLVAIAGVVNPEQHGVSSAIQGEVCCGRGIVIPCLRGPAVAANCRLRGPLTKNKSGAVDVAIIVPPIHG